MFESRVPSVAHVMRHSQDVDAWLGSRIPTVEPDQTADRMPSIADA